MKRFICLVMVFAFIALMSATAFAAGNENEIRILFTSDVHSHFLSSYTVINGVKNEVGGGAKLKTLLDNNRTDNSVYLDAGDFSMGTLLQAGFSTDAYELRLLGELGCAVTTFGNHEFDYGDEGLIKMLNSAKNSGDPLPQIVQTNMITTGNLTETQQNFVATLDDFGVKKYTVLNINGIKMAVFGLFGLDSIDCAPTTNMEFENYIESAKSIVKEIKSTENVDLIICISHCGTSSDGKSGEDIELAKAVPDINLIISGHSHYKFFTPITVGNTIIAASGEYAKNLGLVDLVITPDGVKCKNYQIIPCDNNVPNDETILSKIEEYKQNINKTYLADEKIGYEDIICRSEFDFMSLEDMGKNHQEYPFGNLIADSYIYEAKQNGINDIDVALVGLGTIRDVINSGEITTADAFEICSLGVGADGSAGHPIVSAYVTGHELKLLMELSESLGGILDYVRMSFSGLEYTVNTKRIFFDRITDVNILHSDGTKEKLDEKKLYKVACNMYAVNMLGSIEDMTYGILSITPKFSDGSKVENLYECSLYNTNGKEIKEWVAFKNYLMSFPQKNGVSTIPERYAQIEGRRNVISDGGLAIVSNPGVSTIIIISVPIIIIVLSIIPISIHKSKKKKQVIKKVGW